MALAVTRKTIIAVFPDEQTANSVATELADAGIPRSRIHIGSRNDWAPQAASGGAGLTGSAPEHHSTGFLGWLESLFGAGDSDDDRNRYSDAVRQGNCVVAVDAEDVEHDRAVDIMNGHAPVDMDEQSAASDTNQRRSGSGETTRAIPVVNEELQVGKRAVQRGGVRVYTRTVEQPVEEQVTLRDEKVRVDRRSVDRAVTDPQNTELRDQVIEVVETAEEPVVRKQARVVEEVVVGKEAKERTETVRDTVRKQQVEVEQLSEASGASARGDTGNTDAFRRDFESRYAGSGERYETYGPAYEFGYRSAGQPQYRGRSFDDVENDLRTDYARNNPNSAWDRIRGAVRYGWERVTGKR